MHTLQTWLQQAKLCMTVAVIQIPLSAQSLSITKGSMPSIGLFLYTDELRTPRV